MIIFIGVAGSGKSVQGKLLASDLNCPYFSMGEFLRLHVNKEIQEKMLRGELVNDEESIEVIDEALKNNNLHEDEFILDGFPRTVRQTEWLVEQLHEHRFKVKAVIHLLASADVIVPRLLDRHRPDDEIAVINKRVSEFQQTVEPILQKLKDGGVAVYDINGEGTADDIHKELMKIINSK